MSVTRFRRDSNMEDKVFEAGHWSEWLSAEARVRFQPERSALYRLFRTLVRGFSSPVWVFIGGLAVGTLWPIVRSEADADRGNTSGQGY